MSGLPALCDLAGQINDAHEAAERSFRSGVEHAIRAGELLIQAKAAVPHGAWEAWVRDNVAFSAVAERRATMNARPQIPSIQRSGGRLRPASHVERAQVLAFLHTVSTGGIDRLLSKHYPGDQITPLLVTRAAVSPISTSTATALASAAVGDYVVTLAPLSAGARLVASAMQVDLERRTEILIPTRVVTAAEAGQFITEGGPIPVISPPLTGVSLVPRKIGAIAVFTRELAHRSLPSIESVVGTVFREASALAFDAALFSSTAGDEARPAGLFEGLTPLAASTATPLDVAMMKDLEALVSAVSAAGGGQSIVFVASPGQAAAIKLRAGANFDFPVLASNAMESGSVAAIETSSLAFGFGLAPSLDGSINATLHIEVAWFV